jgi:probable HAF family extracellular repeat protein
MSPIRRSSVFVATAAAVLANAATAVAPATVVAPAAAVAPATAAGPPVATGRLVPLRGLPGGDDWAQGMNDRGDIIGGSSGVAGDRQPVVWWHGRLTPTVLAVGAASPTTISDNGYIAGQLHRTGQLFVWRNGKAEFLRPPAATSLEPTGVNNRGQVIGTAYSDNGNRRAFLWQRGHYHLLPVPRGMDSAVAGINNRGQIIGVVARRGATAEQAVLGQRGRMIRLGTLGGATSKPVAINERGLVIGNSAVRHSSAEHPFRWWHGRMTDLLAHTKATGGRVSALSDTGLMTGNADVGSGEARPVIWRNGRMRVLDVPGYLAIAEAINDRGDVAGLTWARFDHGAVPFRWRHGRTTLYPEPYANIEILLLGIDRHGTLVVNQETSQYGLTVLRSR